MRHSILISVLLTIVLEARASRPLLPQGPDSITPLGPTSGASSNSNGSRIAVSVTDANALAPQFESTRFSQILVRDVESETWIPVSVSTEESTFGNGPSFSAAMSADGRFVVFESEADNLVGGDTNGLPDVFLRDLETQETILVSKGLDGASAMGVSSNATISTDGNKVAFYSNAPNLVETGEASSSNLISPYIWERESQSISRLDFLIDSEADASVDSFLGTVRLSPTADAAVYLRNQNEASIDPEIIAFNSANKALAEDKTSGYIIDAFEGDEWFTGFEDLATPPIWFDQGNKLFLSTFSVDLSTGEIEDLTFDVDAGDDPSFQRVRWDFFGPHAGISESGDRVFRIAVDADPLAQDRSVWMWDRTSGDILEITDDTTTAASELIVHPSGAWALFSAKDPARGTSERKICLYNADTDSFETLTNAHGETLWLEDRHLALQFFPDSAGFLFETNVAIHENDHNRTTDVYRYNIVTQRIELVSSTLDAPQPQPRLALAQTPRPDQLSANGVWLTYATTERLNNQDQNQLSDVYLFHLPSQTIEKLSGNIPGYAGTFGAATQPRISKNGRFVVYIQQYRQPTSQTPTQQLILYDRIERTHEILTLAIRGDVIGPFEWNEGEPAFVECVNPHISTTGDTIAVLLDRDVDGKSARALVEGSAYLSKIEEDSLVVYHRETATWSLLSRAEAETPDGPVGTGRFSRFGVEYTVAETGKTAVFAPTRSFIGFAPEPPLFFSYTIPSDELYAAPRLPANEFEAEYTPRFIDLSYDATRAVTSYHDGLTTFEKSMDPATGMEIYNPIAFLKSNDLMAALERDAQLDTSAHFDASSELSIQGRAHLNLEGTEWMGILNVDNENESDAQYLVTLDSSNTQPMRFHSLDDSGALLSATGMEFANSEDLRRIAFSTANANLESGTRLYAKNRGESALQPIDQQPNPNAIPTFLRPFLPSLSADGARLVYRRVLPFSEKRASELLVETLDDLPILDADNDQVDDLWEWTRLGRIDADLDSDGDNDGVSIRQEYFAKSDPNDPNSGGVAIAISRVNANEIELQWSALEGLESEIEATPAIAEDIWETSGLSIQTTDGISSAIAPIGPQEAQFYRIRLRPTQ